MLRFVAHYNLSADKSFRTLSYAMSAADISIAHRDLRWSEEYPELLESTALASTRAMAKSCLSRFEQLTQ